MQRVGKATATMTLVALLASTSANAATDEELPPRVETDDAKLLRRARRELIAGAIVLAVGGLMSTFAVVGGMVGIVGPSDCPECHGTPATPGFIAQTTRNQLVMSAAVLGVFGHAAMFSGITSLGWSASHKHRALYGAPAPLFSGSRPSGVMTTLFLRF
jgi:hypothetical protein